MHTPMSVRSMGSTSLGHPLHGPDRVALLDRYAISDYASSALAACPATHRRLWDPTGSAGHSRAAGAAGRRPPSRQRLLDPIGSGEAGGAVSDPKAELDIGADKRTST
jgi:hypothetical protein